VQVYLLCYLNSFNTVIILQWINAKCCLGSHVKFLQFLNQASQFLVFPQNTRVQGTPKPPWGKSVEYCHGPLTMQDIVPLLRNKHAAQLWNLPRQVSHHLWIFYNSNSISVDGICDFSLTRNFFSNTRSPYCIINVISMYTWMNSHFTRLLSCRDLACLLQHTW